MAGAKTSPPPAARAYRLSAQQRRSWAHRQEGEPCLVQGTVVVTGRLEAEVLRRALDRVVGRYEIFHTSFQRRAGMKFPLQVVGTDGRSGWLEVEPPPAVDELESWLERDRHQAFDLETGPVLRIGLVEQPPDRWWLLISLPALCADRPSLHQLVRELGRACAGLPLAGEGSEEEPLQYADFAVWQEQPPEEGDEQAALAGAHWDALAGAAAGGPSLPAELRGEAAGSFDPRAVPVELAAGLAARAARRAEQLGARVGELLSACWQLLLWRLAGGGELVVGRVVSGRPYPELEEICGPIARSLPIACPARPGMSCREFLDRLREEEERAEAWQEYAAPEKLPSCATTFELVERLAPQPAGDGAELELVHQLAVGERFKLALCCHVRGGGLEALELHYDAGVLGEDQAERLGERLAGVLAAFVDDPDTEVDAVEITTPAELRRLAELTATPSAPVIERPIHESFELWAERAGERPALVAGDVRWSYAELNRRANRLAHHLRRLGVGPEARVAICAERSAELVAGLLATLKAGGAYVPLDPASPPERLRAMLADVGAAVLLTQSHLLSSLGELEHACFCLDSDQPALAELGDGNPSRSADLQNLAYVLFTSGSTGRPKGVAVGHLQLASYAAAAVERLEIDEGWHLAMVSTFAADLGHTAIYPAWSSGGCLHVLDHRTASDPDALAAYFEREAIDALKIVPSHLGALLSASIPRGVLPRRLLVLGGEAPGWDLIEQLVRLAPECRVLNHYGPTETTVGVSAGPATPVRRELPGVPLGRPLAGDELFLLDRRLARVPIGMEGEIYVGGRGLARGYWGRPGATAERFIPHPLSAARGSRLYKTGDLGRIFAGHELVFLGRADQQVKLRGFRIELGEVEAVLRSHPDVRQAAVMVREDRPGEQRLVAYAVPRRSRTLSPEDLGEMLHRRLPDYMVPTRIVPLKALPLTRNGKLDWRALPEPDPPDPGEGTYAAPRDPVEETLAGIWASLLRVERVGVDDNFFQLGGDSILAIQVIAHARRQGLELQPQQLFEHQTIAELATVVGSRPRVEAEQGAVVGEVPLLPVQRRFFNAEPVDPHHFNQSLLLAADGPLDPASLEAALSALLVRHDALRLRFEAPGGHWRQEHTEPSGLPPPSLRADLSRLEEKHQRSALEAAAARAQASLELGRAPLLRAVVFELPAGSGSRLLLVVHHLVVDGVSWRILLDDLVSLYEAASAGRAPAPQPKTSSLKVWAQRLVDHVRAGGLDGELSYWRDRVERGWPALPTDLEGGENRVASARAVSCWLEQEQTRVLLRELPTAFRTEINDVLLAALALALFRWSGVSPVAIDLEGHGREALFEDVDLSRTVGWLTSHFPVSLEVVAGEDPLRTLRRVKGALRAVPNRGIGYGLLRYLDARPETEPLRRAPEPAVGFNYLGQLDQALAPETWLRPAPEDKGLERSPRAPREHLLEVTGAVVGGRLRIGFRYGGDVHRRATVEQLAQGYLEALTTLLELARAGAVGGWIAADFPLAGLDEAGLERLVASAGGAGIEDVYPASPLQKSLLYHVLASPQTGVGFEQKSSTLRGELDPSVFRATWQLVLDRHPILRTAFYTDGPAEPLQVVHRRLALELDEHDWRGLADAEQQDRLAGFLRADRRRGFDPRVAPLLRIALIRLAEDRYQLVWSYHHLLLDAWCRTLVLREVFSIYSQLARGVRPQPPVSRPFRDYVAWVARQDLAQAAEFWRRELAGCSPNPLGRERTAARSGAVERYALWPVRATAVETDRLETSARAQKITLGTLLHGAWAALLAHHGDARDVLFATTTSGRPPELEGSESMIGMFVNNLPVRVRLAGGVERGPWLARLQHQLAEARRFEWAAADQIQEWSGLPSGRRLAETLVVFQSYPTDEAVRREGSGGIEILSVASRLETSYPLTVIAGPLRPLQLRLFYEVERFDATTLGRMAGHLKTLLLGLAAEPEAPLDSLTILTAAERHQLRVEWAGGEPPLTVAADLLERFRTRARHSPDAIAVRAGRARLSYRELARRADAWASRLVAEGVEAESPVGVRIGADVELAVALLAVLGAGGAFVPHEPGSDPSRAAALPGGARMRLLLSCADAPSQEIPGGTRVLLVDRAAPAGADGVAGRPLPTPASDQLAAWLVRPGAGERPVAVALAHRALDRVASCLGERGLAAEGGSLLLVPGSCWPLAVCELIAALSLGLSVELLAPEASSDPDVLLRALDGGTTAISAPVGAWQTWVAAGWRGRPGLVAWSRGEALSPGLAADLLERGVVIGHLSGDFETCGWSAIDGRPLPRGSIYLLSSTLREVPIGRSGQIGLGGGDLARGYAGRPRLTAERFVPDPYGAAPGGRLALAAVLARRRIDGRLELLRPLASAGWIDEQDRRLGELEVALRKHPGLLESAAVEWRDAAGRPQTVAYVSIREPSLGINPIHESLKACLPRDGVPTLYVGLDRLPQAPDGKVERSALPAPDRIGVRAVAPYVAPCDPIELKLRQIWEEVFGLRPIGSRDNFFELGGHSVLAVRLARRIREELGDDLTPSTFLKAATIEQLAEVLRRGQGERAWSPLAEIQVGGSRPPLFCIHPVGGEILCYVDLAFYLGPDQPVYGLQSRVWSGGEALETTVEEMAETYLGAIRRVQPEGPYRLVAYSFGGVIGLEMARQLMAGGERPGLLAVLDTLMLPSAQRPRQDTAEILSGYAGGHPSVSVEKLRQLGSLERQIAYFVEKANEEGFLPGLDLETVRRYNLASNALSRAKERYTLEPFPGEVTLFRARDGHAVSCPDPTLGWSDLALGGVEVIDVPGTHNRMVESPNVQILASKLQARLDRDLATT